MLTDGKDQTHPTDRERQYLKNLRLQEPTSSTHPDFTIRHAHLSRVSEKDLRYLRSVSDFCINQINGGVKDTGVDKGSMYFIEDHTDEKAVRPIFEAYDYNQNTVGSVRGMTSFSREDIVDIYCNSILYEYNEGISGRGIS